MHENKTNRTENAAKVKQTARLTGYSERYVRLVRNGNRTNETIISVYMELTEGGNKLLEAVSKIVPLSKN